jgi:hypothetical protein
MFDLKRLDNLNISLHDHTYFRQYFLMLYRAQTELDPRTVQPVVSRYTDWAIPAHTL